VRRATALLGVVLVVTAGGDAAGKRRHTSPHHSLRATGPGIPPSRLTRRLGVDENEYSVYPTHNPVGAGRVEFDVTNFGMDAHDLSIRTSNGTVLSSTPVASRESAVVTVNLSPATYTLFCSLLDHEARGMHASLVVR
jgi:plastocyanin